MPLDTNERAELMALRMLLRNVAPYAFLNAGITPEGVETFAQDLVADMRAVAIPEDLPQGQAEATRAAFAEATETLYAQVISAMRLQLTATGSEAGQSDA